MMRAANHHPRILFIVCVCLSVCVLLHAEPVHAALQSTGILDRATEHFQSKLAKWRATMTQAALVLFWMLATAACVWELGNIALRGGGMDAAVTFLVRFAFIEGLWLYIILHSVPIGKAIVDSMRQLGSTASGIPEKMMPSEILDIGFALLWKTTKFVAVTGWSAPIVALVALVLSLVILLVFGLTAINMVLLVVSQWFLIYGGIFFLGFGGAPWESDKAKNYLYLALSIGAQLFGMATVVGIGQSFIEEQYQALSGDTALGELVVILLVGTLMYLLANEIPKLLGRLVPGSSPVHGFGMAAMLGGIASVAAAFAASTAMARGAMESMGGIAKAAIAARDAVKAQSQPQPPPRSQTGISSSGGSIGPAGGGGSNGAGTRTQGPLGTMLTTTGIGPALPSNGAGKTPAATRAGTNTATPKPTPSKAQTNQSTQEGNENAGAGRGARKPADGMTSADPSQPSAASLRGGTRTNGSTPRPSTEGQDDRAVAAEAEASSHRSDCEPHSDEANGTGEADAQHDTQSSTHSEHSAARADTSSSSNAAASAPEGAGEHSEDAASTAPTHAAPTGVDGDADVSAAHPSAVSRSAATSTSADPASAPAAASNDVANTARSATAGQASAPVAATTSVGTGTQNMPPSAATTGAGEGSSTQNARPAGPSTSATPSAGEASSGSSKPASALPASPESETTASPGGQRGSTAIGGGSTVLAAAKVLGEHTYEHYRARGERFKDAIMARVDNTAGGQIAQMIRKKYGLDQVDQDSKEPNAVRSTTTISASPNEATADRNDEPTTSAPRASGPKHPADWITGDEPMTEKQAWVLQKKLGADFDPDMTKAEASMLIEELLDGDQS